jgi:Patatin-like phospholipase
MNIQVIGYDGICQRAALIAGLKPSQARSKAKSAVQSFGRLRDLLRELSVCGFSLCMAVLGGIVFLYVEQGQEVLRALAERGDQTGATNVWRILLFGFGLFLWSVASWYSARVLLDCKFFNGRERPLPKDECWSEFRENVRLEFPRLLGVLPFAIVGTGFLLCTFRYESTAPWGLNLLCALCYAAGVLMYFVLRARRKFINSCYAEEDAVSAKLKGYSRISIRIMGAISLLFALLLVINPILFAGEIGTGAVLVIGGAAWVFWGSVLVYFGQRVHLPLLVLAVLWVALCSLTNDNHDLRTVTPTQDYTRPKLSDALKDWHDRIAKKYPGKIHPLYIVASEGGGIRAAYWTAAVLGTIQDEQPTFADHIFAISGVSGGSLGAAVFTSLLPDGRDRKDFARRAEAMLGRDFLSPATAAMLCPDFLQRFWPWGYTGLDRGRWIERSWENAWRDTMQNAGTKNPDRFAQSFLDLWRADNDYVPNLCLNGTSVERGKRVIASNLLIDWKEFLDADDAIERLMPIKDQGKDDKRARPGVDLPISAAAHLSARFTYVSPAGKFPPDGTHVVDGGYFENSGATTALDILREITREMSRAGSDLEDTVPKLIMISNNPTANAPMPDGVKRKMIVTTEAEQKRSEPSTFLGDAIAPVNALLNTRDARGTYAQRAIGHAQEIFYENLNGKLPPNQEAKVYYFSLAPAEVPLPLGWMLSNRAARAMNLQLNDEGKSITTPVETWNKIVRAQIIASLPPPVPVSVGSNRTASAR